MIIIITAMIPLKHLARLEAKLLAKRVVSGECWLWTGPVRETVSGPRGYAQIWHGEQARSRYIVPRVAWEIWRGPIPDAMSVCHICDRTLCFRPEHLFLGTQKENMADCSAKGRIRNGYDYGKPRHRLSLVAEWEIQVRRAGGESGLVLAKEFGVHHSTVYKICAAVKGDSIW